MKIDIETAYNIGDEVKILRVGYIISVSVTDIKITYTLTSNEASVSYRVRNERLNYEYDWISEEELKDWYNEKIGKYTA